MYGARDEPPAIEKIRKAQWTVENTRATQAVVGRLLFQRDALQALQVRGPLLEAINDALARFALLDPKVQIGPR